MTEFVIQLDSDDRLVKSYVVTEESPRRSADQVPDGRLQLVIEDKAQYDVIVDKYTEFLREASYIYDSETKKLSIDGGSTITNLTLNPTNVIDKKV